MNHRHLESLKYNIITAYIDTNKAYLKNDQLSVLLLCTKNQKLFSEIVIQDVPQLRVMIVQRKR